MGMNWFSLAYLAQHIWPYLAAAGLIGLVVGWRSFSPRKA